MSEDRECFRCGDVILYCKCVAEFHFAKEVITEAGLDPGDYDDWLWHPPSSSELQRARAGRGAERADWYEREGRAATPAFCADVNRARRARGLKEVPPGGPTFWEKYAEDVEDPTP